MLDDGAYRILLSRMHLDPPEKQSPEVQIVNHNLVFSSLPQASQLQCAAIMRMHVLDNVRQRIEAGHMDFVNEIRRLSILFLGFPGLSRPISNTHPDEALQSLQLAVTNVQIKMVEFDGTFLQFRCDEKGFLAICAFGLPGRTHVDDCSRAIEAALKIVSSMEEIGHQSVVGVTTGDLLCACVGSSIRAEYTVFGDAINLSARLMCKGKCGLGKVLCDQATYESAKRNGRYVPLAPLFVKGKTDPIIVYSVHPVGSELGSRTKQVCTAYSGKRLKLKPIIGHKHIMEEVTDAIRNVKKPSKTKAFVLEGGPGCGKTKMIDELQRRTFEYQETQKQEFYCQGDAACKSMPLHPWRRIFEDLFMQDRMFSSKHMTAAQLGCLPELSSESTGMDPHATPLGKSLSASVEGYEKTWRIHLAGILELPLEIIPLGDSQLEECISRDNHNSIMGALVSLAALVISMRKNAANQEGRTMMKLESMQEGSSVSYERTSNFDSNDGSVFSQKRRACTVEDMEWIHHKSSGLTSNLTSSDKTQNLKLVHGQVYPKKRNIEMSSNLKTKKLLEVLVEMCQTFIRLYGPMIIFLEDLHHFDTMSWNLLRLVLEDIKNGCIIVASLRGNDGSLSAHAQATQVSNPFASEPR